MSKALLICNGENNLSLLKRLAREADFILAADAGAEAALRAGLRPDAVIGDLDSLSPRTRLRLKDTPLICVPRQDNTDFAKALDWLLHRGFIACDIAGCSGKRMDFTIGNLLAGFIYAKRIKLAFKGNGWTMYPLTAPLQFQARKGARASLIPVTNCRGITLTGFAFPLQNASWKAGETMGTSNIISAQTSRVSFSSGKMLLYVED